MSRDGQQGFVLVNALIIVAALSAVAVGALKDSVRSQGLVAAGREASQLDLMGDAGVAFAADLLRRDARGSGADHLGEQWALDAYPVEAGRGTVTVWVRDLQGRLNLNLLVSEPDHTGPVVDRLFAREGVDQTVADAVASRFEPFAVSEPGEGTDDEDEMYVEGDMVAVAELALLPGLSEGDVEALGNAISTLPRARRINVNTASRDVLSAALDLNDAAINALIAMRSGRPFDEVAKFEAAVVAVSPETESLAPLFDVGSDWFEVTTRAELEGAQRTRWTILHRDRDAGTTRVFAVGASRS